MALLGELHPSRPGTAGQSTPHGCLQPGGWVVSPDRVLIMSGVCTDLSRNRDSDTEDGASQVPLQHCVSRFIYMENEAVSTHF